MPFTCFHVINSSLFSRVSSIDALIQQHIVTSVCQACSGQKGYSGGNRHKCLTLLELTFRQSVYHTFHNKAHCVENTDR